MHETDYHQHSAFVTLTYADEFLPEDGAVHKDHLQLFLKRLRRRLEPVKLKYYATGEYGEKNGRPHYHIILYGLDEQTHLKQLHGAWPYGLIHTGTVTYDSARYVADYVHGLKKLQRKQPFALCSKGLGKRYAEENLDRLRENPEITIGGVPVGLPKYYVKQIQKYEEANGITTNTITDKLFTNKEDHQQHLDEFYTTKYEHAEEVWRRIQLHRAQTERNLRARTALYRKGNL